MIGINSVASYRPSKIRKNYDLKEKFQIDDNFIRNKIGIEQITIAEESEQSSDLCCRAIEQLILKTELSLESIGCLVVVTQNPDYSLPHTSAIVHKKMRLPVKCAAFDVSLGCSGYVYGLSIIKSFMESNNIKSGLLLTADPYSKIVDENDKNTTLLFGDGAAATLINDNPYYQFGKFTFGTIGSEFENLIVQNGTLSMNGRGIFNFAMGNIPNDIANVLELNDLQLSDINKFIFHPGSKFIVDSLVRRLKVDRELVESDNSLYGNTISSSIPMLLEPFVKQPIDNILLCGFGVGLSWASTILKRVNHENL